MQTAQPDLRAVEGVGPVKLEVEALSFFYGKTQALHDVSFEVREKRVTAIIGPSGCGKSRARRIVGRGEGPPRRAGRFALGRAAPAVVDRPLPGSQPRGDLDGRAMLGP